MNTININDVVIIFFEALLIGYSDILDALGSLQRDVGRSTRGFGCEHNPHWACGSWVSGKAVVKGKVNLFRRAFG